MKDEILKFLGFHVDYNPPNKNWVRYKCNDIVLVVYNEEPLKSTLEDAAKVLKEVGRRDIKTQFKNLMII